MPLIYPWPRISLISSLLGEKKAALLLHVKVVQNGFRELGRALWGGESANATEPDTLGSVNSRKDWHKTARQSFSVEFFGK